MKSFTECFAEYGAKLANPQWAVSAVASDGAVVISCWSVYFSRPDVDTLRYSDTLSRWAGNVRGNLLLRTHLQSAHEEKRLIKLVIATPVDSTIVDTGGDASKTGKKFHTKPDVVGRLVSFDGDAFVIDFKRVSAHQ